MSINTDQIKSLRFKDLLAMTEPGIQTKRLPRASRLRESDAEILFTETLCGATITLYRNGYVIYNRDNHDTVITVKRCANLAFIFNASNRERTDGSGVAGCHNHIYKRFLYSIIPEEIVLEFPWYLPIFLICETRLDNSQESREAYHIALHIDNVVCYRKHGLYYDSIETVLGLNT